MISTADIMFRTTRVLLALALSTAVVACATTGKFKQQMNSWVGNDINNALAQFGPPSSTYKTPNGNTMYTWSFEGGTRAQATYVPAANTTVANMVTHSCRITFLAEPTGRIAAWRANGNMCRSR
jgi:hypothetical protein